MVKVAQEMPEYSCKQSGTILMAHDVYVPVCCMFKVNFLQM